MCVIVILIVVCVFVCEEFCGVYVCFDFFDFMLGFGKCFKMILFEVCVICVCVIVKIKDFL